MFFSSDIERCARIGDWVTVPQLAQYNSAWKVSRRYKKKATYVLESGGYDSGAEDVGFEDQISFDPQKYTPIEIVITQLYFDIENGIGESHSEKEVENFSFWPCLGDTVLFDIKVYFDWLAEQRKIQTQLGNFAAVAQIKKRLDRYGAGQSYGASWGGDVGRLLDDYKVTLVEGVLGVVQGGGETIKVPLIALRVLEKADGRKAR